VLFKSGVRVRQKKRKKSKKKKKKPSDIWQPCFQGRFSIQKQSHFYPVEKFILSALKFVGLSIGDFNGKEEDLRLSKECPHWQFQGGKGHFGGKV
jgi:hypothetical protein